jgi:hypothetical protein
MFASLSTGRYQENLPHRCESGTNLHTPVLPGAVIQRKPDSNERGPAAVDAADGDQERSILPLISPSNTLHARFSRTGDIAALHGPVESGHAALAAMPSDHRTRAECLNNLFSVDRFRDALAAALADPDRDRDAIVVGEYERAFYSSQYAAMAPLFEHHGVQLWIPEAGRRPATRLSMSRR